MVFDKGKIIRAMRESGLDQRTLSEIAKVKKATVYKSMNGISVNEYEGTRISKALGHNNVFDLLR